MTQLCTNNDSLSSLIYHLKPCPSIDGYYRFGQYPCEHCGNIDKGCMIHEDLNRVVCTQDPSGQAWGGQESVQSYLHYRHGRPDRPRYILDEKKPVERVIMASVDERNKAYSSLKKTFGVSQETKELCESWGVNTADVFDLPEPMDKQYYSDTYPERFEINVPGLFKINHETKVNQYFSGIAFCLRDMDRRITGVEIRLSEECKDRLIQEAREKGQFGKIKIYTKRKSIYRPFQSTRRPQGAGRQVFTSWFRPTDSAHTLIITEGFKDGAMSATKTGFDVVALMGVTNWKRLVNEIEKYFVTNKNCKRIVLALDMDRLEKFDNKDVFNAHKNLKAALAELALAKIEDAEWDYDPKDETLKEYKGLGDFLKDNEWSDVRLAPMHNKVYVELKTARKSMIEKSIELLTNPNGMFNEFKVSAGVGKTYAFAKAVSALSNTNQWPQIEYTTPKGQKKKRDAKVCFAADTKKLVAEIDDTIDFDIEILHGRSGDEDSPFYCERKDFVDQVAASGKNTYNAACRNCDVKDSCPYLMKTREILNEKFVLTTKAGIFNNSNRLDKFDIVITDESMRNIVLDGKQYTKQDLINTRGCIQYTIDRMLRMNGFEIRELAERTLGLVADMMSDKQLAERHDFIRNQLKEHNKELEKLIESSCVDSSQVLDVKIFPELESTLEGMTFFRFKKNQLPDGVEGYYSSKYRNFTVFPKNILGHGDMKALYFPTSDGVEIRYINRRIVKKVENRTFISLDATPISSVTDVFQDKVVHDVAVKEKLFIKSLKNLKLTKRQVLSERYNQQIIDFIFHKYEEYGGNFGVVTSKAVYTQLQELGYAGIDKVCYYGNDTRGTNKLKDVDAIAVVGVYIENIISVAKDEAVLRKNGMASENLHKDITIAEMIQSFARGRGVTRKENLILYKMTNIDIPGYFENEVYDSIEDMKNGVTVEKRWELKLAKKNDRAKTGSKQAIVPTDPPEKNYIKNTRVTAGEGGQNPQTLFLPENLSQTPSTEHGFETEIGSSCKDVTLTFAQKIRKVGVGFLESLKSLAGSFANISSELMLKAIECMQKGILTMGGMVKHIGCSEATVKRIRRAVTAKLDTDTRGEVQQSSVELAEALIEEHFEEILEAQREEVSDAIVLADKGVRSLANKANSELAEAISIVKECPFDDDSYAWYWMCWFKAHSRDVIKLVFQKLPHLISLYIEQGIEDWEKQLLQDGINEYGLSEIYTPTS